MASDSQVKELVEKIHQFLSHQVETNGELSEAAKESLTVASECIEQAYKIQRKPASSELLDIFSRNRSPAAAAAAAATGAAPPNPAQFIQNLATSILSSASASVSQASTTSTTAANNQAEQTTMPPPPPAPRVRKNASEAERMAAESFKNQGNDFMKQDKYKEAYDYYSQAIEIDDNNAIYYSNRAAASSKLGDHQAALRDCQEAVLIDSNYSKAYGRMGLAYASLDNHQKAKEAYVKAVELDPLNESYRNNLKIAEDKLASESSNAGGAAGGGIQNNMMSMLRSMMSNPEVMSMAMRSLQDPRMQNLFGMATGDQSASTGPAPQQQQQASAPQQQQQAPAPPSAPSAPPQPPSTQPQTDTPNQPGPGANSNNQAGSGQQQQQPAPGVNPADLFNLTSRLAGSANIDLVGAGQQLLSQIQQNNPDLVDNMRRMMGNAFMPPNPNDSDRNPPPGYS